MLKGIDVSYYQEDINWENVKNGGVYFAFIKSSETQDYKDKKFDYNWSNAKLVGVARGAYHFFRAAANPAKQAQFFIKSVGEDLGELPLMIDVELHDDFAPDAFTSSLSRFLKELKKLTDKSIGIYTGPGFWNENVEPIKDIAKLPLWVANWGVNTPLLPRDWKEYLFWQYKVSNKGEVQGIRTRCDMNYFNGDLATFNSTFNLNMEELPILPPVEPPVDNTPTGTVMVNKLKIRKSPSTESAMVGLLSMGDKVKIYETKKLPNSTWIRIGDDKWCASIYYGQIYVRENK